MSEQWKIASPRHGARRAVCGVGVNDADYSVVKDFQGKRVWRCPFYARWLHMLNRCYGKAYQIDRPTYVGCSVCEEWLTFSKFKSWMELQNWQGKHLDKDILVPGNRVYGPDTCVFVDPRVNSFFLDGGVTSKGLNVGSTYHRATDRYRAYGWSAKDGKRVTLGSYKTAEEASSVWLKHKSDQAAYFASIQDDPRVASALISRYAQNG